MNSKNLTELYDSMQVVMRNNLEMGRSAFEHSVTKGDVTETHWRDWLKDYLPKRYCVDRAFVIDSNNHTSEQIDIVVYDQQYSHPVFVIGDSKYITAESVYAVFEVKQVLNKETIEYAGKKIKSVRELTRTSAPIESANGHAQPKPLHRIISGLLTLDSDWVMPIRQHTVQYMMARPSKEQVDLICCLKCGSFATQYDAYNQLADIICSSKEQSLIFFFLELLKQLQKIGTVPAIDIRAYEQAIQQFRSSD